MRLRFEALAVSEAVVVTERGELMQSMESKLDDVRRDLAGE